MGQCEQFAAPSVEKVPTPHGRHSTDPFFGEWKPEGQRVQPLLEVDPVTLAPMVPAGQSVHLSDPLSLEYDPGAHDRHSSADVAPSYAK
mmetsp:Transcript_2166/g.7933  ORF Transcript_2166/g.7933 Transcript_2166/m.7933 type:complete len:89 (-) Transcript_2166:3076-3342(-)